MSRYIDRYINADALLAWYDERRAEAHYRLIDGKKRSVRREARTEVSLFDQMYFKICKLIGQNPDVEEVRHGKWRDEREDFVTYVCSVCNKPYGNQYNYCPNCGARMDGEKEE